MTFNLAENLCHFDVKLMSERLHAHIHRCQVSGVRCQVSGVRCQLFDKTTN